MIASELMKTYCFSCYVGIIKVWFEKAVTVPNEAEVLSNICQHSLCFTSKKIAAEQTRKTTVLLCLQREAAPLLSHVFFKFVFTIQTFKKI